jgi:hypothetical protein
MAASLKIFLTAHKIIPIDGEDLLAVADRNKQILERIRDCKFLIAICLKDHPNEFIHSEIGFAKGRNIPVILITDDAAHQGAIIDSQYKLKFHPDGIQIAAELMNAINSISKLSEAEELHKSKILDEISQFDWFSLAKSKKNYHYAITLEEHQDEDMKDRFFSAVFDIDFEGTLIEPDIIIETSQTDNNFVPTYDKLVKNPRSIYRYILKTEENISLKKHFTIKKVTIEGLELQVALKESSAGEKHIQFICSNQKLPELLNSRVKFKINIETIVDKRKNEFTVLFGYPVENFKVTFMHNGCDIKTIEIVDILTSKEPTIKNRYPSHSKNPHIAQASYSGWVFPNSGITYVWNRTD